MNLNQQIKKTLFIPKGKIKTKNAKMIQCKSFHSLIKVVHNNINMCTYNFNKKTRSRLKIDYKFMFQEIKPPEKLILKIVIK